MSIAALPKEAELRNWAARELGASGEVAIERMPRLLAATDGAKSPAEATLKCYRDEQHRYVVEVDAHMTVFMQCQRCLHECEVPLSASSRLCVVWTDESIKELPESYDPLVTGDITQLPALIEDELLLSLPVVPLHNEAQCGGVITEFGDLSNDIVAEKENPFAALQGLLKSEGKEGKTE